MISSWQVGGVLLLGEQEASLPRLVELLPSAPAAACAAIEIEYEPLPAYYDAREALEGEVTSNPHAKRGNLSKKVRLEFGEVDTGIEQADLVVEAD